MNVYLIASSIIPDLRNGHEELNSYDIIKAENHDKALAMYNEKHNLNLKYFWSYIIKEIDEDD